MRILIVDDHTLFREGLKYLLKELTDKLTIVEAASCEDAFVITETTPEFQLILLDLSLPGISGFEALTVLHERHPHIPVVVLSASENPDDVIESINRGAMGYIPKSFSSAVMLAALRLVFAGGVYLPQWALAYSNGANASSEESLSGRPEHTSTPPETRLQQLGLTERQIDVFSLLVQGKPNKIIARELDISETTVKFHVTAVFKALKVSNRTQALWVAARMGLTFNRTPSENVLAH